MSHTAKELLIIYESEAEQWATYLHSVFASLVSEGGICRYDIATASRHRDDFLQLARYTCKFLILSKGLLEGLCPMRRFFLGRVLTPSAHVVVLLCGVDSLAPLLELVPLDGNECLQVSSEQDAQEYLSTVMNIVGRGVLTLAPSINPLVRKPSGSKRSKALPQPTEVLCFTASVVVVPHRVPCRSSSEVFVLLRDAEAGSDTEVEFSNENQTLKLKPVRWNERVLCVNTPDFPPGSIKVTVYTKGGPLCTAHLEYYSSMEEVASLLERVVDPVEFMCQAFQQSSLEKLDQQLSSMILKSIPSGGFQELQHENTPEIELHHSDVPSFLHFAARYGFRSVSGLLLQCPGAERALQTVDCHGHTPAKIAKRHGHTQLHLLLKETLAVLNSAEDSGNASVYETMCAAGTAVTAGQQKEEEGQEEKEEEEEIYAPLGVNDEYDTILNSTKAPAIANRPPAPTPRPQSSAEEDRTPYIAKVFLRKPKTQLDLYSLPTKPATTDTEVEKILTAKQKIEHSLPPPDKPSSSFDPSVLNPTLGPQQLLELQQRLRTGPNPADGTQRGPDGVRQERVGVADEDSVYDKIHIHQQTAGVAAKERWRGSRGEESDFYSKPLKGHTSNYFLRGDRR